jgi:hypothetical protein
LSIAAAEVKEFLVEPEEKIRQNAAFWICPNDSPQATLSIEGIAVAAGQLQISPIMIINY